MFRMLNLNFLFFSSYNSKEIFSSAIGLIYINKVIFSSPLHIQEILTRYEELQVYILCLEI